MSKISIIAPIYNQETNLGVCIESVLTQTLTDYELILINNGSTDRSGRISEEYAKQDNRISVIHREEYDIGAARNTGLSRSTGEYIVFIDCDDFLHIEMLKVLYDQIIVNEADIALCDFQPIEEGEVRNEGRRKDPLSDYRVTTSSGIHALHGLYDVDRLYSVPWSKMYRKNIFNNITFPVDQVDEDEFVAHRLLYQAALVIYIHEPLYYYVVCVGRKGSETPIPMTVEKFDKVTALYERAIFFRKKGLIDLEEKALLHFLEHFFWYYLQSQEEIPEAIKERKQIKKLYNQLFFRIMGNSLVSIKRKMVYTVFRLSPYLHKTLTEHFEDKALVEQP